MLAAAVRAGKLKQAAERAGGVGVLAGEREAGALLPLLRLACRPGRENEERNTLVCDDICAALAEGRRCLVLSQWKEHCNLLAEGLRSRGFSPVVLEGGLGKRARAALLEEIERTPLSEPLVVVATGQYLGEGFDCPQLDTLFLAFPVSFKGRLVQYTGRILRAHENKTSAYVYDYADVRVPVLRAMHTRRLATYKQLRFRENDQTAASPQLAVPILAA